MVEPRPPFAEAVFAFDRFQVVPGQRLLLEEGKVVRLGSRAFDILLVLVAKPGERIGKGELLGRVWPNTHVVEGNLKFQMATLRRVLGDGRDGRRFIETSQGQGYCFVAPISVIESQQQPTSAIGNPRDHTCPGN